MANPFSQSVDYFVMHALKNCPRLRHLYIWNHELSIDFINQIAQHGQKLSYLELDFGNTNASNIFSPLLMKKLKYLGLQDLKQCNYKTDDLLALIKSCVELNSLCLYECEIPNDTISQLIDLKKEKLKYFEITPTGIDDEWLQHLENCPKLEHLYIGKVYITQSGFEAISKLKNLKYLQLGFPGDRSVQVYEANDAIIMLSNGKFKKMEVLNIYGIIDAISPIIMCALLACPNLQYLTVECITDKREDFPTNIIKVLFDNLTELRELKLSWWCRSTDNSVFIKSHLEEIVEKCKYKLEVDISENDDCWNCGNEECEFKRSTQLSIRKCVFKKCSYH